MIFLRSTLMLTVVLGSSRMPLAASNEDNTLLLRLDEKQDDVSRRQISHLENPPISYTGHRRTQEQRKGLSDCVHWAVGIEHETMLVHRKENGLEEYAIDANKVLREMARFGQVYGLSQETHAIAAAAHNDGAEFSGRKCANSVDLVGYKTMMEAVSKDALQLSFDGAYDQIQKIDAAFIEMANQHPFIRKATKDNGLGTVTRPLNGMSTQLGMYQRTMGSWFECASCGSCSLKDYTGSYHMSLSLPSTPEGWIATDSSILSGKDTCASGMEKNLRGRGSSNGPFAWLYGVTDQQVRAKKQQDWIAAHTNLANMVQWVEPLLVAAFGTADADSVCDSGLYTEGSFRSMRTGWGVPGTTDVRSFQSAGTGRYVKNNFDWIFPDAADKLPSAYRKDLSGCVEDGMGADIRTKSSVKEEDLQPGESLPPMQVGRGIEIRIFDNFPLEHVPQVYRMIVFLAEAGREFTASEYIYDNADWTSAIQAVMREGWNAILPKGYVHSVAAALNMPSSFLEEIGENFQAFHVYSHVYKSLWECHSCGMWSDLMLDDLPDEMPELVNPNRDSWESGAINMGYTPDRLLNELGLTSESSPRVVDVKSIQISNSDSCGEDVEDLVYLAESLGVVSDIDLHNNGTIKSFLFMNSGEEEESTAFASPVCMSATASA